MQQARILIVDDHPMFAAGLSALLSGHNRLLEPELAYSGEQALEIISRQAFDLICVDIHMPQMSGIELTRLIKRDYPEMKVLVVSMHDEPEIVHEIFMAEAEGYILKNAHPREFFRAIDQILDHNSFYDARVLSAVLGEARKKPAASNAGLSLLSEREKEVLRLIVSEHTSDQIAIKLNISRHTVDSHRKNMLSKLGIRSLAGLIRFAWENGLS